VIRKIIPSILIAIVGVIAYFAVPVLFGAGTSSASPSIVLDGVYTQTQNDIPNTIMTAVVEDNTIEITLRLDSHEEGDSDVVGTYWAGTFDTGNPTNSFGIVSKGNQEAMSKSLFGSQDPTKTFAYKDGDLSFDFSMLKLSTVVHLSKQR
jgi:hypothetical protein